MEAAGEVADLVEDAGLSVSADSVDLDAAAFVGIVVADPRAAPRDVAFDFHPGPVDRTAIGQVVVAGVAVVDRQVGIEGAVALDGELDFVGPSRELLELPRRAVVPGERHTGARDEPE